MYYMYQLEFNSFLHIGNKQLDSVNISMDSDTFFSAIINEIAESFDNRYIDLFVESAKQNKFLISNLFPFEKNKLYLPKPIIVNENKEEDKRFTKKENEDIEYIDFKNLNRYYNYLKCNYSLKEEDIQSFKYTNFGEKVVFTKNNLQKNETELFNVEVFKFKKGSGLYFFCYLNDDLKDIFNKVMKSLSYTGIGGKKSIGYGNFTFKALEVSETKISPIYKRLVGEKGEKQMLISYSIPLQEDLQILKNSDTYYEIVKKTGFKYSKHNNDKMTKKKPVIGVKAGSIMNEKMKGDILDISTSKDKHSIYKYGKAMYFTV